MFYFVLISPIPVIDINLLIFYLKNKIVSYKNYILYKYNTKSDIT